MSVSPQSKKEAQPQRRAENRLTASANPCVYPQTLWLNAERVLYSILAGDAQE